MTPAGTVVVVTFGKVARPRRGVPPWLVEVHRETADGSWAGYGVTLRRQLGRAAAVVYAEQVAAAIGCSWRQSG